MSDSHWDQICNQETTLRINANDFCIDSSPEDNGPIDDFLFNLKSILKLGDEEQLERHEALGRVLLLGIVSATELYFRNLLASLIDICPKARNVASSQVLTLGAVDYYGADKIGMGLLDGRSLASVKELKSLTQKVTGLDLNGDSSLEFALKDYQSVCQLRHAAVHAHGKLGANNINELGIEQKGKSKSLKLNFKAIHDITQVCMNAVRAYNRVMFKKTIYRWIDNAILVGTWGKDQWKYKKALKLFYSTDDIAQEVDFKKSYNDLLPEIIRRKTNK